MAIFIYLFAIVYTIIKILLSTPSTSKTLGYLLLVIIIPLFGMIFYYAFGQNLRHRRSLSKTRVIQAEFDKNYKTKLIDRTQTYLEESGDDFDQMSELVRFLHKVGNEYLSKNTIKLLINGEEKFPDVLKELNKASKTIHMEYYDWENDTRGNQIKDILLNKVKEGVIVRVIYDDYASRKIKPNIIKELKGGGVLVFPQIKIQLAAFANRVNHRDHRKLIIIDSYTAFIGGINISDRYDNSIPTGLFWRDTHARFRGPIALNIQRHFIISWNACQEEENLSFSEVLFQDSIIDQKEQDTTTVLSQVCAGGPIYLNSNIMMTYFRVFTMARDKLYVTNPYFIPNESIINALKEAAFSGVDVRVLVPEKSDSAIVGAASRYYFEDLLYSGVRIFLYKKGFVHAKTVTSDGIVSVIGTANMDIRSFDLNFEIMSVNYSREFANRMEQMFFNDLEDCDELTLEMWDNLSVFKKLWYSFARLMSAFL
nr:cardiolipin synthase [Mangrovivirga halotolerans]